MDSLALVNLILEYRYWILIPLSFLEGPVIAVVAGGLAALGYFNLPALFAFFFIRDIVMDSLYYALGYFGSRTKLVAHMLKKLHFTSADMVAVRTLWERRPAITMFLGKLAYGIAVTFIVIAGILHMRFRTFLGYGAVVALVQYTVFLGAGYYFGNSFGGKLEHLVANFGTFVAAAAIFFIGYFLFVRRMRKEFLDETDQMSTISQKKDVQ